MTERAEPRCVAARNLVLRRRQKDLLSRLAGAGIPALAVKGVGLAEALYPDLSCREVSDVDLLVRPADVTAAFAELTGAGLRPNHPWTDAGLRRLLARPLPLAPELVFSGPDGLLVELHWDWPCAELPANDPFDDPEAYLVYLCRHAGKHFWSEDKWLHDIARFAQQRGHGLDWPRYWSIARQCRATRSCAVTLQLCGWEAPGLGERLDRAARGLASEAGAQPPNSPAAWQVVWRQLRLASWRDRAHMAAAWLAPQPHDWNEESGRGARRRWTRRASQLWRRWARVRGLSATDWWILAEAYVTVLGAEAARRTLTPARLLGVVRRQDAAPAAACTSDRLRRLAWLVDAAANRQPFPVRCLTRALALTWMLRRRGLASELRIGVKQEAGALQAHAWVEYEGQVLNGPPLPEREYAILP